MTEKNHHWGTTLDDFLKEEGIYEDVKTRAIFRVLAWQVEQAMIQQRITKTRLAELLQTSRAQVDRILGAKTNVEVETLVRAATFVGRKLRLDMV